MTASIALFLAGIVFGAGFAIGYRPVSWLIGKVLAGIDRAVS